MDGDGRRQTGGIHRREVDDYAVRIRLRECREHRLRETLEGHHCVGSVAFYSDARDGLLVRRLDGRRSGSSARNKSAGNQGQARKRERSVESNALKSQHRTHPPSLRRIRISMSFIVS